jgi:hypothetical protein
MAAEAVPEHQYAISFRAAGQEHMRVNIRVRPIEHPVLEPIGLADIQ